MSQNGSLEENKHIAGSWRDYKGRGNQDYLELVKLHDEKDPPNIIQKCCRGLNRIGWAVYDTLHNIAGAIPVVNWFTHPERKEVYGGAQGASETWIGNLASKVFLGIDQKEIAKLADEQLKLKEDKRVEARVQQELAKGGGGKVRTDEGHDLGQPQNTSIKPRATPAVESSEAVVARR